MKYSSIEPGNMFVSSEHNLDKLIIIYPNQSMSYRNFTDKATKYLQTPQSLIPVVFYRFLWGLTVTLVSDYTWDPNPKTRMKFEN